MGYPLPNLSIHQLLYVREVARSATLTEAAARLGVTQSALSQGLAEFERRMGAKLFDRRSRAMTPQMAASSDVAEQVLALIEDLVQHIDEIELGRRGALRLGMIDTAALGLLAEPVRQFRQRHPDVRTTLVVEPSLALTAKVASGELDLAVVVVPNSLTDEQPERFTVRPIQREPIYLYGPGAARQKTTTKIAGPWVSYPKGSQSRDLIETALAARGITGDVVAESSNPDVLRQMVRLGVGWCALPAGVAESGADPLTRFEKQPLTTRTICVVQRKASLPNGAIDAFVELLPRTLPQQLRKPARQIRQKLTSV